MQIGHINVAIVIDVRIGAVALVRVSSDTLSDAGEIERVHDPVPIHVSRIRSGGGSADDRTDEHHETHCAGAANDRPH
jgi:hypothetical protein